ncbi:MAG: DUF58 domain-containing protein [Caulobacteraceae bacterium]|nr:DUF58 domain-containing protein [Caulobacteraceae bacterium]
MIYPTRRAVALAAAGAPVALLLGLLTPRLWVTGAVWLIFVLGLMLLDALSSASRAEADLALDLPASLGMGRSSEALATARFAGRPPRRAEIAIGESPLVRTEPPVARLQFAGAEATARLTLEPRRRGLSQIGESWLRWTGPLGLTWTQIHGEAPRTVPVLPDLEGVKAEAIRLFARDALMGVKLQLDTGDGSDFHALNEARGAIDPRTVDWKQSARHHKLLVKEFRTERNHPVIVAIDTGHEMCSPLDGAPRVDRAINAALLLAFVALKTGDRAGAYGFDARPGGFSGVVSGAAAFPRLQRHLARLDYSEAETNFTLGLTQLGALIDRRSLIVIFTEFADATSAELMVENVTRLLRRHVVLFVVFEDPELDAAVRAPPDTAEAVARAVTARGLLRARQVVLARLARLGVQVVEAPAARMGAALIDAYLQIKRAELL